MLYRLAFVIFASSFRCYSTLIVLSPPGHHYDHYDSKRVVLYEFIRGFHRAANETAREQVFAIADDNARRNLFVSYGVKDTVHGVLDDIWMKTCSSRSCQTHVWFAFVIGPHIWISTL